MDSYFRSPERWRPSHASLFRTNPRGPMPAKSAVRTCSPACLLCVGHRTPLCDGCSSLVRTNDFKYRPLYKSTSVVVDEKDFRILAHLARDPFTSNERIGQALGLSGN